MIITTLCSFAAFTAAVALGTYLIVRRKETSTRDGYFLAGRSLTFPFIAGSLLLTNLSTEQLVGLNGSAFSEGFAVMAWEVLAVVALVAMAWFFLPRFLRAGVTTVPEYLSRRFDRTTGMICNIIFLLAYTFGLLPIVLYTGAVGITGIFGLDSGYLFWMIVFIALAGAVYALFGGLRSVAVSDTLNGIGLLIGGFMVVCFALAYAGKGDGIGAGLSNVYAALPEKFDPVGKAGSSIPFGTLFTGVLIVNLFYWCTNQQIIQRTFGASSLAEGQKGVLLCGALKLLGPLYLVLPGVIAFYIFGDTIKPDLAYGKLVSQVLPPVWNGFLAAVLTGAVLSSFNSALNSSCTLFSLGIYKEFIRRDADDINVVRSGKYFGWIVTLLAVAVAPLLAGTQSIFTYLQYMNTIYFIPIFSVVLIGMITRQVPARAANAALVGGCILMLGGTGMKFFNQYHYAGCVFLLLTALMLLWGRYAPQEMRTFKPCEAIDLTPWRYMKLCGILLLAAVLTAYLLLI